MDHATALRPRFRSIDLSLSALLILLLLVVFVFYPLGETGFVSGAFVELLFSLMLISGVVSLGTSRATLIIMSAIAFGAMLSGWLGLVYSNPILFAVKSSLTSLLLGSLVITVLIEVFRDGRITSHRVQGRHCCLPVDRNSLGHSLSSNRTFNARRFPTWTRGNCGTRFTNSNSRIYLF
jgi:hypothetical protein